MASYERLNKKFHNILKTHGKDVYLRRRCLCDQSGPNQTYSDSCPECGGTGFVQTIERHTMRMQLIGTQTAYISAMGLFDTGIVLGEGNYFYCLGSVLPKYGDLIYDFAPSENRYRCYQIEKALERRFDDRILFYTCACNLKEEHSGTVSLPS
jgi:hypothetical protein